MARKKKENAQKLSENEKPEAKIRSAKNRAESSANIKTGATKKTPVKKKPAPRKPQTPRPTAKEKFEIAARRARVLELKKSGVSVRRIAALLQIEGVKKCSASTVQSDLNYILDECNDELMLDARRWRALLIERNEEQYFRVTSSMIQPVKMPDGSVTKQMVSDTEKENLLQRNQAFLDKLVAASKAEQSKNSANEALAALLGVSPDQLPDDDEIE